MSPELEKSLQTLADKLGVGADRLWACLLKQAPISSTLDLVGYFVVWCALLFGIYFSARLCVAVSKKEDDLAHPLWLIPGILAVVIFLMVPVTINDAALIVAGYFNPDYWALHQILHP